MYGFSGSMHAKYLNFTLEELIFQKLYFVTNRKADNVIRYGFFQTKLYGGGQKKDSGWIERIVWITRFFQCGRIFFVCLAPYYPV